MVYLIPLVISFCSLKNKKTSLRNDKDEFNPLVQIEAKNKTSIDLSEEQTYESFVIETKRTFRLSLEFCFMWFCSNYFYNSGLANTSVTSSTVLCNTSSIFVYLISLALLENVKLDKLKGFLVLISFSGIVTVTLSDEKDDSGTNSMKGNLLSLLSAMFYGLYAVVLKKRIPDAH